MDLWIRSQDKDDLIKVCSLEVASRSNDKYTILTLINSSTVVDLGTYETKERALEVLGEIDERIMLLNTLSIAKDRDTLLAFKNALPEEKLQGLAYPYEMPKE